MSSRAPPNWVSLETLANDGRYMSWRRTEHVPSPHEVEIIDLDLLDARTFGEAPPGDYSSGRRAPVLASVAQHLGARTPAGERLAHPSSSLRTVYPIDLPGWALKLHIPDALRDRHATRGKNFASKEIGPADAMIGPLYSRLLARLESRSPYLGVVEEPSAVAGCIGEEELGAVFRRLPDANCIPGFALYSQKRGVLRSAFGARPEGLRLLERQLPAGASRLDRVDASLELFVDPLLDIFFSLASQGVTLQMHAQNILFEMDAQTGRTRRVWVRDLAGLNHAPEYRARRGQGDLLAQAMSETPGATVEIYDAWLRRGGRLRRQFEERFLFGFAYDAQLSAFVYQLMTGFWRRGFLRTRDLRIFQIAVQRRAQAAAEHHDFDPDELRPIATPREGLWGGVLRGLELRALFRPER